MTSPVRRVRSVPIRLRARAFSSSRGRTGGSVCSGGPAAGSPSRRTFSSTAASPAPMRCPSKASPVPLDEEERRLAVDARQPEPAVGAGRGAGARRPVARLEHDGAGDRPALGVDHPAGHRAGRRRRLEGQGGHVPELSIARLDPFGARRDVAVGLDVDVVVHVGAQLLRRAELAVGAGAEDGAALVVEGDRELPEGDVVRYACAT